MNMAIDVNVLFHDIDISFLNQLSKYNIFYRKKIIQYFNDNINEDEIKRIKNLIKINEKTFLMINGINNKYIKILLSEILKSYDVNFYNIYLIDNDVKKSIFINNNIKGYLCYQEKNYILSIENNIIQFKNMQDVENYLKKYYAKIDTYMSDPITVKPSLPSQEKIWSRKYTYSQMTAPIQNRNVNLYDYLFSNVAHDLNQEALIYFENTYTFKQLKEKVDALAYQLVKSYAIKPEDVVAVCMPNTPEAIIALLAINKIGAVCSLIHPLSKTEDIIDTIHLSGAKMLFITDNNESQIDDINVSTSIDNIVLATIDCSMSFKYHVLYNLKKQIEKIKQKYTLSKLELSRKLISNDSILIHEQLEKRIIKMKKRPSDKAIKWEDLKFDSSKNTESIYHKNSAAFLLKTGGTTGTSKMATITNENCIANIEQLKYTIPSYKPGDTAAVVAPIFHGFGLVDSLLAAWCVNMRVNLHPRYDPEYFNKCILKYNVAMILGPPTLFKSIISSDIYNDKMLPFLKILISGSDKLADSLRDSINNWKQNHHSENPIFVGMGLTEATAAISFTGLNSVYNDSVGYPLPENDVKIISLEDGHELNYDEIGELCISGPTVMKEYYNNPSETNQVLKEENGKIWLHTGDICSLSKNGEIRFVDRKKGIIIVSGINVYRKQVEEVVNQLKEVQESAAIGIPHPYKMHVIKVYVVLKPGYRLDDKLKKEFEYYCNSKLDAYQKIYDFEQIDRLPLSKMNKIDYLQLEEKEHTNRIR